MNGDVYFSLVTPTDILVLQQICRETFRDTYEAFNTPENIQHYLEQNLSVEQLNKELTDPNSRFYFAKSNDELVGYMKLNFPGAQTALNKKDSVEIERIYVKKSFQGKKFGYLQFQKAVELARENNCSILWLGVWEHNTKAYEFYKKQGLTVFDSHEFILGEDVQKDWLMQLSIG